MKKLVQILVIGCIVMLGIQTLAIAQSTEIIDKILIQEIRTLEIKPEADHHYMYVNVIIKNENTRELLLSNNEFTFSLCQSLNYKDCRNKTVPVNLIGYDVAYRTPKEIEFTGGQLKDDLVFKVDLGTDTNEVLKKTVAILNFVGKTDKDRTLLIEGKLELGVKTTYGWSRAEAIVVEWQLCPDLMQTLPIKTPCQP